MTIETEAEFAATIRRIEWHDLKSKYGLSNVEGASNQAANRHWPEYMVAAIAGDEVGQYRVLRRAHQMFRDVLKGKMN